MNSRDQELDQERADMDREAELEAERDAWAREDYEAECKAREDHDAKERAAWARTDGAAERAAEAREYQDRLAAWGKACAQEAYGTDVPTPDAGTRSDILTQVTRIATAYERQADAAEVISRREQATTSPLEEVLERALERLIENALQDLLAGTLQNSQRPKEDKQ